jgi:hypothetical protein
MVVPTKNINARSVVGVATPGQGKKSGRIETKEGHGVGGCPLEKSYPTMRRCFSSAFTRSMSAGEVGEGVEISSPS